PPLLERGKDILGSLKLSDGQQKKIDGIVAKAKEDFQAMRNDLASREPRERMGAVSDFMQDVRGKIEGVLTDEQKEAFSKKVEEARQRIGGREGGEGFAERLKENLSKLDLSDEQKAKVKDLMGSTKTKMQELREQA